MSGYLLVYRLGTSTVPLYWLSLVDCMAGRLTLRHLLACTIAGAVLSKENAFSLVVYCNFKNVMYISKQGIFSLLLYFLDFLSPVRVRSCP